MAKLTGKKWYDALEWSVGPAGNETCSIFGYSFPNVTAIHTYYTPMQDAAVIRWKNRGDDQIHEYQLEPEWMQPNDVSQIQALLVAIRMS